MPTSSRIGLVFSKPAAHLVKNIFILLCVGHTSEVRLLPLNGDATTHRFDWSPTGVHYQSFHGYGTTFPLAEWNFAPPNSNTRVPQTPIPVHMNLWLLQGRAPFNGQPIEVHIRDFRFTPRAE